MPRQCGSATRGHPPELLDGRSNGAVASDVYSLGATIWNLLVGRSPFSIPSGDNSSRALAARILHSTPPRTQRPDVPPALDLLLQQCRQGPAPPPPSALEGPRRCSASRPRRASLTMIAVETDVPSMQDVSAHSTESATALKPVTVISGSARMAFDTPLDAATHAAEQPPATWGDRARMVVLVVGPRLLGVAIVLFLNAGDDDSPPATTPTPTVHAQRDRPLGPDRHPRRHRPPYASGRVFRWTSAEGTEVDDTWLWHRTDTSKENRTADDTVTLTADERVCVQVRLIRDGFLSPWGICAWSEGPPPRGGPPPVGDPRPPPRGGQDP